MTAARALARLSALAGGAVLMALVALVCLSVLGREANALLQGPLAHLPGAEALVAAGLGAVPGDFEIVEAGIAFAVFAFLPWTQVAAGHAVVTALTDRLGPAPRAWLAAAAEAALAAAMAVVAVQLAAETGAKRASGQTTILLEFPVWWTYAACLAPAALGALTALLCAGARLRAAASGRDPA